MTSTGRRRYKRHEVRDVYGSLLFRVQVSVVNISLNGMAVETAERLRVGRSYSIKLSDGTLSIEVEGLVKWCRMTRAQRLPAGEPVPIYRAGISFDSVLSEPARELMKFLESHVLLTLENRIFGRFKLKPGSPVDVSARYDFLVHKISLSGMLIQTELAPQLESRFDMELRLTTPPLEVQGRVAYVKQIGGAPDAPLSEVGVEFVDLNDAGRSNLESFIAEHLEG